MVNEELHRLLTLLDRNPRRLRELEYRMNVRRLLRLRPLARWLKKQVGPAGGARDGQKVAKERELQRAILETADPEIHEWSCTYGNVEFRYSRKGDGPRAYTALSFDNKLCRTRALIVAQDLLLRIRDMRDRLSKREEPEHPILAAIRELVDGLEHDGPLTLTSYENSFEHSFRLSIQDQDRNVVRATRLDFELLRGMSVRNYRGAIRVALTNFGWEAEVPRGFELDLPQSSFRFPIRRIRPEVRPVEPRCSNCQGRGRMMTNRGAAGHDCPFCDGTGQGDPDIELLASMVRGVRSWGRGTRASFVIDVYPEHYAFETGGRHFGRLNRSAFINELDEDMIRTVGELLRWRNIRVDYHECGPAYLVTFLPR